MASKRAPIPAAVSPVTPGDASGGVVEVPYGLLASMLNLQGSAGGFNFGEVTSAGIPVTRAATTMMSAQRFRADYYRLPRKRVGEIARLVTERNWFASRVHETNCAVYGAGFRFKSKTAAEWLSAYPIQAVHDDCIHEYLVSNAVVALWRSDVPRGTMPFIEVPDMETVDYEIVGGVPQITVKIPRQAKLRDDAKRVIGEKMFDAATRTGRLVIRKGRAADDGFDFAILKRGKSSAPVPAPSMTGVLDDLDFIECVRVGDWNGAYARREIIRLTKKGSGVSSGPNAGTARNNARYKDIQAILAAMKKIAGKADLATNWDQDTQWLVFAKDFFGADIVEAALRRLIFWGGIGAIAMLKTDSQMAGMSALLYDTMRVSVEHFRARFAAFLRAILTAPTFLNGSSPPDDLEPVWSVKPLYSTDAFVRLTTAMTTNAWLPPQVIREDWFGVDDEEMCDLMKAAHADREGYTPPYEPRQGLLPGLFPADFHQDGATPAPAAGPANDPGRPAAIA
jgi:hypothetical protein